MLLSISEEVVGGTLPVEVVLSFVLLFGISEEVVSSTLPVEVLLTLVLHLGISEEVVGSSLPVKVFFALVFHLSISEKAVGSTLPVKVLLIFSLGKSSNWMRSLESLSMSLVVEFNGVDVGDEGDGGESEEFHSESNFLFNNYKRRKILCF